MSKISLAVLCAAALAASVTSTYASEGQLAKLSPMQTSGVSALDSVPTSDCATLKDRLVELQDEVFRYQKAATETTQDTANVMASWHATMSSWEGRTLKIGYGTFDPVRQSAETARTNAQYFAGWGFSLNHTMNQLVVDVATCLQR